MNVVNNLNKFFTDELDELNCKEDVKAYIVSIFDKFKRASDDLSTESITILYSQAKYNQDFQAFQRIGDYIFFSNAFAPESFIVSEDYYFSIGRLSYYSCYKLINKQWILFEQLADDFVPLSTQARSIIRNI